MVDGQNLDTARYESQADHQYLDTSSPLTSLDEAVEPFGIYHGDASRLVAVLEAGSTRSLETTSVLKLGD